ncbi:hypothetical protein ACJJI5_16665 [Microbulbifer sp. EKSA008]|uniref:hypothetical protein n=1 Tax=unclassified Microbulbifer TaxID=2619833 RepID=UPI00403901AB
MTDADSAFQATSGTTQVAMDLGKLQEVILVGLSYSKGSKIMPAVFGTLPPSSIKTGNI